MYLSLLTPAAAEPISVKQLKSHLRVDGSDEDPYLATLIVAARRYVEDYTNRQLITATWELIDDHFPPHRRFEVPNAPLLSVSSIKYTAQDGTPDTVFPATDYTVSTPAGPNAVPGSISLKGGGSYPSHADDADVVKITFDAGYGPAATDVPDALRHAILLLAAEMYARREQVVVGVSQSPNNLTAERLMHSYRVSRWYGS